MLPRAGRLAAAGPRAHLAKSDQVVGVDLGALHVGGHLISPVSDGACRQSGAPPIRPGTAAAHAQRARRAVA
jgi:hypothetical protein